MKLAIMQPYFFPYLGYFSLIKSSDYWIVFDTVQFIRHGWIERNRIMNSDGEWQYIKVPLVKKSRGTSIQEMDIRIHEDWKKKIYSQLSCYKNKAKYYNQVIDFLKDAFSENFDSIVEQNTHLLKKTCEFLSIDFNYEIFSYKEYNFENKIKKPGDWALEISKLYRATEYINPENGRSIFESEKFEKNNLKLSFIENTLLPYKQFNKNFIPGLSIIDVMMFNDKNEVNTLIDSYIFK